MSSEKYFLALQLVGSLQSWGFNSQFNRRNTGLMPTKSAIAGMCCAALGYSRGSIEEKKFLDLFQTVLMTAIAIPREVGQKELPVRRLLDFHTVQNTKKAGGGIKKSHMTHRQYITDAAFGVLLEGNGVLLNKMAGAFSDPVWGLWLGRKSCIPSAPILVGVKNNRLEALSLLIGEKQMEAFTRQQEVTNFKEGRDSLPDQAVTFDSGQRFFSPRRIDFRQAGEK